MVETDLAAAGVEAIGARVAGPSRAIILIDGGSGAGKTDLATLVAARIGAQLVSLDDMYPGWDGLESASTMVRTDIIERSRWRRWDWTTSSLAEWHRVDARRPLVIEGCGALSRENRAAATFGVWLEVSEPVRRARALARDGESYRPHWDRWAAQERRFFERERPDRLADLVLTGE